MPKPTTKHGLVSDANTQLDTLWSVIDAMTQVELCTPFDFSNKPNKTQAHWSRDKNVRDVLIHLYEWHQLLINWIECNLRGHKTPFLPNPYTWKNYSGLNLQFWKQHQTTTLTHAVELLQQSHTNVLNAIKPFSEEQLFTKKCFDWTGTTHLASYCTSSTSSHYTWAIKKIRAHRKTLK